LFRLRRHHRPSRRQCRLRLEGQGHIRDGKFMKIILLAVYGVAALFALLCGLVYPAAKVWSGRCPHF
jgi:hypothetical protein